MLEQPIIAALNHVIARSPWAQEKLAPFAGREALFVMSPLRLQLLISADGKFAKGNGTPDVEITLPANTPLIALQGTDKAMRNAHINGSVEFADTLGFVLRHLSWDFEEDLSRVVGDIAAHRIAESLRTLTAWQKQAAQNLAENTAEYLRDETGMLPSPQEISVFSSEVDRLRDDLARLEKRLQKLG
jgi:ubiquinone biosynthesis accessory factor UbiJ